jgi:hypothetical protein
MGSNSWLTVTEQLPEYEAAAAQTEGNAWFGAGCMLVVAGGLNVIELSPARAMLAVRRLEEGPAQPVVLTFTRMHLEAHAYKQGQLRVCRHPRAPT